MPMANIALTTAWSALGTGLSTVVLQSGGDIKVYIGSVAPTTASVGFSIKSGKPVELPGVAALGGGVWVKASRVAGGLVYAVA